MPDVDSLIFIDGNMTDESYQEILENNLLKSVEKLGISHDRIFQYGNDPKHRAAIIGNWLTRKWDGATSLVIVFTRFELHCTFVG